MSIVRFDGQPSWSLDDASETVESTKCPKNSSKVLALRISKAHFAQTREDFNLVDTLQRQDVFSRPTRRILSTSL